MLKTKWNRWVAAATSLLLVGVTYVALFAQEQDAKPTATLTAKTLTIQGKPNEPDTLIFVSGEEGGITLKTEQSPTAAEDEAVIRVPLDSNTFPGEWLNHNKGNRAIFLFAEGTGITKQSVGTHRIGSLYEIREFTPKSPSDNVLLVTLEIVHQINPKTAAHIAAGEQKEVDDYHAKKFRFLLRGLVPLGEPIPDATAPINYPRDPSAFPPQMMPMPPAAASPNFSIPASGFPTTSPPITAAVPQQKAWFEMRPKTELPATGTAAPHTSGRWVPGEVAPPHLVYEPKSPPVSHAPPTSYAAPIAVPTNFPASATLPPSPYATLGQYGSPPVYFPHAAPMSPSIIPSPRGNAMQAAITKLEGAKSDEEKETARTELRKVLTEIFAADMQNRDKQAADIEARVKKLREQYDARENAKDEIIELQLKLLEKQAEGLEFPGSGPAR
ncbi:hypothetical protein LOC69_13695 [Blastopirellula sp. JC733]|nr:hypothetical protein [Blastopirellula sediminis]